MKQYSTNLTDKQWQVIEKIIDTQHRKRKHDLRIIPHDTVFYYFNKWKQEGLIEEICDTLHLLVRQLAGRDATPTLGHEVINVIRAKYPKLKKILADGGYGANGIHQANA